MSGQHGSGQKREASGTLAAVTIALGVLVLVVLYGIRWCWRRFE